MGFHNLMVKSVDDNLKTGFNSLSDQIADATTSADVSMDDYPSNQTYPTVESSSQQ